jgi:hypothetical protein
MFGRAPNILSSTPRFYHELSQMGLDKPFANQLCSVMHDWRNAIKVSLESILLLLYGKTNIIVI